MCDHCNPTPPTPIPAVPRRAFLHGAALTLGAAALAACGPENTRELPDPYAGTVSDEYGGSFTIDPKKIVIPSTQTSQASDYGTIMPRAAWTSTPLTLKSGNPMGGVTRLTIHHSGDGKMFNPASPADVARHLQIVLQAHLQRGMIDIGYHFAVDPRGQAWQLRSLAYEGQHVRISTTTGIRNNEHNVGIVALGDFNRQTVTPQQFTRLLELVRTVRTKYSLPASSVFMHGEIVQTDCPGTTLKAALTDARRKNEF